jgi:hypothetical protein
MTKEPLSGTERFVRDRTTLDVQNEERNDNLTDITGETVMDNTTKSTETIGDENQGQQNEIDYDEQAETLAGDWFNPDPGKHEVKFLDNGNMDTVQYSDDEEPQPIGVFTVEVDGKKMKWSVNQAKSSTSLWGQLILYGKENNGLEGETITLVRSGTGTDTNYTVPEAAEITE